MSYYGDISAGLSIYLSFNTVDAARALVALTGSPAVSVYKDDGTTESTAGVTLSAGFDGRTGLNLVKIDTSADGTFYAAGHDFTAVITTGTVDSVSAVGYLVGSFSIENRSVGSGTAPSAAAIRAEMDSNSTKLASIDAKTTNLPSDPADASDIASSFTTVNSKLDTIDDFLDTEVAAVKAKTDSLTFTSTNLNVNVEAYNGVTIPEATVVSDVGNTALAFKTDRTETADNFWKDAFFRFNTGSLAGQCHRVTGYTGATKFLIFTTAFTGIPANGDVGEFVNR